MVNKSRRAFWRSPTRAWVHCRITLNFQASMRQLSIGSYSARKPVAFPGRCLGWVRCVTGFLGSSSVVPAVSSGDVLVEHSSKRSMANSCRIRIEHEAIVLTCCRGALQRSDVKENTAELNKCCLPLLSTSVAKQLNAAQT